MGNHLIVFLIITAIEAAISLAGKTLKKEPFRVVFVHTSIPGSCGPFSDRFKAAIRQAQLTQSNRTTEVVVLSNFKQCRWSKHDIQTTMKPAPALVDAVSFRSKKTHEFEKLLKSTIDKGVSDEDTIHTSFYRYLMLEDYVTNRSISQLVSLETDTMVYGDIYSIFPHLKRSYPKMAMSPSVHKKMVSSAFMWVGNVTALRQLNNFFVKLTQNETGEFNGYINWLRDFSCCKPADQGGIYPDESGVGLKPWAVSDMTMISYYRHLHHREIKLLHLLPRGNYQNNNKGGYSKEKTLTAATGGGIKAISHVNLTAFSQGGAEVGGRTGIPGIFDSSKYGWFRQYKKQSADFNIDINKNGSRSSSSAGTNEASTATSSATTGISKDLQALIQRSIIEQASNKFNCTVEIRCSGALYQKHNHQKGAVLSAFAKPLLSSTDICLTGPHVLCTGTGGSGTMTHQSGQPSWTPLWYFHVPKNDDKTTSIEEFVSQRCACSTAV